ncbi:hypothetical protein [Virgibacillus phasianinus]|uniref:hypothetical protein n=1 Tax=Virgibacillus phasianinus TaxID=2017483 RepID=UPI001FE503DB|nr:hypothetical protein [Virgibacillus phasianinus]
MDTKTDKVNYVWYASYGSNLSRERFLCYIEGGQPKGSADVEIGCSDNSLPIKEATHIMQHPLYFAKASARWQNQGVAFIGLKKEEKHHTYSRKYLITEEQFKDVVKQENGVAIDMDLDDIKQRGLRTLKDTWYGTLLYVGEEDGYPIFTFTADFDSDVPVTKPSKQYLGMIINGLRNTLKLDRTEVVNYLSTKPGVADNYSREDIEELMG